MSLLLLGVGGASSAANPDPGAFWADSFWHTSFNSNAFWF